MPVARKFKLLVPVIGLIVLGAAYGVFSAGYYGPGGNPSIQGMFWPDPNQLYPFVTVDDTGAKFGLDRLKGKWSFLFFGYTHCPDICPLTLTVMNQVYTKLKSEGLAGNVQMLFVTIDPQRDTTKRLADFVHQFNPAFKGLGGSRSQIHSLAGQLGVATIKENSPGNSDYQVDHSASLFLVDPDMRLISLFSTPEEADDIVSRFIRIRDFIRQQ
jgi:cytochrome oxidase Cu insertion factor (SCO1/SenC/PrrC family)